LSVGARARAAFFNDLYRLDAPAPASPPPTWTNLSAPATGAPPSARRGHGFAAAGGVLFVFGGWGRAGACPRVDECVRVRVCVCVFCGSHFRCNIAISETIITDMVIAHAPLDIAAFFDGISKY
jgi:hypothetical protein